MTETIVIIKDNFKVSDQSFSIFNNKHTTIVSLDYESHKQLKKLNIEHTLFENFLNKTDLETIDSATFKITTTWYKNKKIHDALTFDGINFGWLIEQEFYFYLLTIITNFISLIKIKEKFGNPKQLVISNNLLEMSKIIFPKCEFKILPMKNLKIQQFNFDIYSIKYNIGPIPLTVRLPRKYFFILRNFYEKSFIPLYNKLFSKIKKNTSSILLIDFNPAREDEFIKCISKKNVNVFLLNRRRSTIWNSKSFLTVKNTKSIPITYTQFLNSNDRKEIDELIDKMVKNLELLFSSNELFSQIFSICDLSFWNSIHKYFKSYCLDRFSEAIFEMIGSRKLLLKINPSIVLHFFGVALQEKIILHELKKRNILSMLVQHGTPHIFYPNWSMYNPIAGTLPIYDEKMVVWGNMMKEYAIVNGMKKNNIIVSGSIRHDSYFSNKVINCDHGIILVALMPYVIFRAEDQALSSFDVYEESLKILCKTLKKIKDRKKIFKLHPGDMKFNSVYVEPIIRNIDPTIQIIVDADLIKLIPQADIVITLGLTTFLLDANIFQKPTVTLMYNHGEFLSRLSNGYSVLFENSEFLEFEDYIQKILTDKKFCDESIRKGNEFVNSYLVNHGSASEYLANKIIDELI